MTTMLPIMPLLPPKWCSKGDEVVVLDIFSRACRKDYNVCAPYVVFP